MATQVGTPSTEGVGRRTRDKPVQSYRDLMNPLTSKDYITGKKGLPRSERNLNTNSDSVPVSPTEGSSSDNGTWSQQPVRRTSRKIKPRLRIEDDSSPEIQSHPASLRNSLTPVPVSRALVNEKSSLKVNARLDTTNGKKVLVISGLKPFHWIRFTPQIHVIEDAKQATRPPAVSSTDTSAHALSLKKSPLANRATSQKDIMKSSETPSVTSKHNKEQSEDSSKHISRPGLVRLFLKRKLPDDLVDFVDFVVSSTEASIPKIDGVKDQRHNPSYEETVVIANKVNKVSAVAAGKRPAISSPVQDKDRADETLSDTASESSDDIDFSTWELPLAYHDYEKPNEDVCEDAADFVLRSRYRSLPDATAFAATLTKKIEKRSTADLYNLAQGATDILRLWQDEYIKLDRITAPHSITQRRPVLGGRVPIESQIYEDIKESILYDYVYDPRKPPGFQDPVEQKAKSAVLSRELRQRRKRKLDFDQADEAPIEPYRTRRHVAANSHPVPQNVEQAMSPAGKSSPQESLSTNATKKRGRPAKEREVPAKELEIPEEPVHVPRNGSNRGRGAGAHARARGNSRTIAKGRSRGLAIRYEDEMDATVSDEVTADEAETTLSQQDTVTVTDVGPELGDATSEAFDKARAGSAQPLTVQGSKPAQAEPESLPEQEGSSSSSETNTVVSLQQVTNPDMTKASVAQTDVLQPAIDQSSTKEQRVENDAEGSYLSNDHAQPARELTTPQLVLEPPSGQAMISRPSGQTENAAPILQPITIKRVKRKRATISTKPSAEGGAVAATMPGKSAASTASKGKRRRAVSTNTSQAGRSGSQIQFQVNASTLGQHSRDYLPRSEGFGPAPLELSWPMAINDRERGEFRHFPTSGSENYAGVPMQSQRATISESSAIPPQDHNSKINGLEIRVPPRKNPKQTTQSDAVPEDATSDEQRHAQDNSNEPFTQAQHVDAVPAPPVSLIPESQSAAQVASARLTKSLIDHAAQAPNHPGASKTPSAHATPTRNSSEDRASSSGDAATGSNATSTQKVDKRRLKKPPSQLRSETMTKWWADRKAKKLAEKESLKSLQARSQERMLLAGDASRPSVNPFMLGERPLLAYTPLGTVEGQASAQVLPSPTAAMPSQSRLQSPMNNVFPRAPSDSTIPTPSHYPYSVPTATLDGRSPSTATFTSQPGRNDNRGYGYMQSPGRPPSPREERRQSTYPRQDYSIPNRPSSPVEPFRPPTLPSLSQITDPSYQANGSDFGTIRPRTQSQDLRVQHTYPAPPNPIRPIDPRPERNTRPPHVYPHNSEHSHHYDSPSYPSSHNRHAPAQQYWPPVPSTVSHPNPQYYPPRAPLLPSPRGRAYDQPSNNMSPGAAYDYRHEDYTGYSQYPAAPPPPSHAPPPHAQSYWPPGPGQSYQRRQTPPLPANVYPAQHSQYQYPPSYPTERPALVPSPRSPIDDHARYSASVYPRDDMRMYGGDDRDASGTSGPPIDPELLR